MPYYEYPRHQTPTFYTFPSSPQSRQGERNRSERKTTEILLQDVGTLHDTAMVERWKTDMYGILIYSFVCPCRHAGIAVGSQIPPAPSRTEGGPALSQDLHVPSRGHPFVLLGSREHLAPDARRDFPVLRRLLYAVNHKVAYVVLVAVSAFAATYIVPANLSMFFRQRSF